MAAKSKREIKLSSVTAFRLCEPHRFLTSEITWTHAVPGHWGRSPTGGLFAWVIKTRVKSQLGAVC